MSGRQQEGTAEPPEAAIQPSLLKAFATFEQQSHLLEK